MSDYYDEGSGDEEFDLVPNQGRSFPFNVKGDEVKGLVVSAQQQQQTDMDGKPKFWDNGNPMTMIKVILETQLRDDGDDDGRRAIYLKGSAKPESRSSLAAVLQACQEAHGKKSIKKGWYLSLKYVDDGVQTKRGLNPPKLYTARHWPANAPQGAQQTAPAPQGAQQYAQGGTWTPEPAQSNAAPPF